MSITIYHNKRCGKSSEALALLQARHIEPKVVLYLETPPDAATLKTLLKQLAMKPLELIRQKEPLFKELYKGKTHNDQEWIDAMVAHPILIERPIVTNGQQGVIARPAEKLLPLL